MGDDVNWLCLATVIVARVAVPFVIGGRSTETVLATPPVMQVIPQPMSAATRSNITSLNPFYCAPRQTAALGRTSPSIWM